MTVTGSGWIVFISCILVQKQMCAYQTPKFTQRYKIKCLSPAIIHIIHCKSSYNYTVLSFNSMFCGNAQRCISNKPYFVVNCLLCVSVRMCVKRI